MASITLGSELRFGFPPCQSLKSRITMLPFLTTGWEGGLISLRASSRCFLILPLARSPCSPSWSAIVVLLCVPGQISVDPFSGVIVTRGTLMTRANGIEGWSKSASLWVGCDAGGDVAVGGRAVLPDKKRSAGLGPSAVEVIWVTIGSDTRDQYAPAQLHSSRDECSLR